MIKQATIIRPCRGKKAAVSVTVTIFGKNEPLISADCVSLISADQRNEGGGNQR